ncbi:MAG TPA: decarboxylating 6-phosphogluconate dehydrogenase [Alphaproteobacteria bacterium]|nr:decarboxylating 6-phosphogluconate dehydrogenase [Alphaproteobacteria bacterium]
MQLGLIGLGRMGGNIVRRLQRHGHHCIVYDRDPAAMAALAKEGATASTNIEDLVSRLEPPRTVWVMLPAGEVTDRTVLDAGAILARGDTIIDGGNSFYRDDIRRAAALGERGVNYLDVGTSGGVRGLERGYCLMIGGSRDVVKRLDPLFAALAPGLGQIERTPGRDGRDPRPERGYVHCGPVGAGHFVKMVHNGIEYGLMQAYAEGLDILKNRTSTALPEAERYELDLADIAEAWRRGSVVSSWLLDLSAMALTESPSLNNYTGVVEDSGEGRWTVGAAIETAVPAEVLSASLYTRFRSRQQHTFAERILSAMRFKFGGHIEHQ